MTDSVESFSAMLRKALGSRVVVEADSFVEMLAEDGVMEFPYAPPGLPTRLDGKAEIAQHLERLRDQIAFDRTGEPLVHATADPNVVVVEFEGFGRGVATSEPYDQRYISVIRTRGGRIVHYRDYWNPLAVLRAIRGPSFVEVLAAGAHDGD